MEFYKIKKLLSKNPKLLKDDPVLSIDYFKIISLIKRKKLLENTSDSFNAEDQTNFTWNDLNLVERAQTEREKAAIDKFNRSKMLDGAGGGEDYSSKMSLAQDEEAESDVRKTKKKEAREHQKIIQQFDKLAT